MKLLLQHTKDYLLLIDEDADKKQMNTWYWDKLNNVAALQSPEQLSLPEENYSGFCLIVAHYPLTKTAKELSMPWLLLPNPFKTGIDIVQLSAEATKDQKFAGGTHEKAVAEIYFRRGYQAAQSDKLFSLEDIKNAFRAGMDWVQKPKNMAMDLPTYIQSLSTQQLPKEFIPEYKIERVHYNLPNCDVEEDTGEIKTIINSSGKTELVGEYVF